MFLKEEDNKYKVLFTGGSIIESTLAPGVYSLEIQRGMFGSSMYLNKVNTFVGKKMINAGIYKEINDLINIHLSPAMKEAKDTLKLRNKLGLMFKGLPGTGKTFAAGLIGQRIVDELEGYCIITKKANGSYDKQIISSFREFTDKPIVYIYDEFEKSFDDCDSELLSFLDGVDSPENVINIATVNKTSNLPDFITNRPGRFERIIEFSTTDKTILESIIKSVLPAKYNTPAFFAKVLARVDKSKNKTVDNILIIIRDCLSAHIYRTNLKALPVST